MTRPPRAALAVLLATTPEPYRAEAIGDLLEEFALIATINVPQARRWFWRQAVRSLGGWTRIAARRLRIPALATALLLAIPLFLLDRFWTFSLSLVPLKEDPIRTLPMILVTVAYASVAAALLGRVSLTRPWLAAIAALCPLLSTPARLPLTAWFVLVALPAAAAAAGELIHHRPYSSPSAWRRCS